MRRLRETWLALGGSALIIALSVTSALGADPALDAIENVGQRVSEFAQSLNGQNQDGDEPDADEEPDLDEDEQLDEADADVVEADEEEDEVSAELEPGDEDFDWSTVSHGFCVSWHARADETAEENLPEDGEEWKNHGEFVSHWARVGCNESPDDTEDADEADEDADDEEGADAAAERKAEREAEKAERKAEREAARAAREAARAERNNSGQNGNGRGNGRGGGGRP